MGLFYKLPSLNGALWSQELAISHLVKKIGKIDLVLWHTVYAVSNDLVYWEVFLRPLSYPSSVSFQCRKIVCGYLIPCKFCQWRV